MGTYSVTIRTLGTAGEKYQKTLDSIARQSIPPQEVIIVLPKGYPLPPERLGTETFIFSEKGMVAQRVAGFNACTSDCIFLIPSKKHEKSLDFGKNQGFLAASKGLEPSTS